MRPNLILSLIVVCFVSGCTSFKTTSLYRKSGHKVVPQNTNAPLKGLPVKMKVPSHVNVVVYEQQLILAAGTDEKTALAKEVTDLAIKLDSTKASLKALAAKTKGFEDQIKELKATSKELERQFGAAAGDALKQAAIKKLQDATNVEIGLAEAKLKDAVAAKPAEEAKLNVAKDQLEAQLKVAKNNSNPPYRLVSFNPPQYIVSSDIEYTDKVFLVDFKRPAGGILDLTSAKLDDEQYFSQVKAEVTERTVEDISSALSAFNPQSTVASVATPTSADTPAAEANSEVHFQKSVVAMKRFDVSQQGWEQQMMDFVNGKLQGTDVETISAPTLPYETQMTGYGD